MPKPVRPPVRPPVTPHVSRVPNQLLACMASGLMLGQIVLGLARQHDGALVGLVCALVFVLAGGASVLSLLQHLHTAQQPRGKRAPTRAWLLALGAGLMGSMVLGNLL